MEPVTKTIKNLTITVSENSMEVKDFISGALIDINEPDFVPYYNALYKECIESYKSKVEFKDELQSINFGVRKVVISIKNAVGEESEDYTTVTNIRDRLSKLIEKIDCCKDEIIDAHDLKHLIDMFKNGYGKVIEEMNDEVDKICNALNASKFSLTDRMVQSYFYIKCKSDIRSFNPLDFLPKEFKDNLYESGRCGLQYQIDQILEEFMFDDYMNDERSRRDSPHRAECISTCNLAIESGLPDLVKNLNLYPSVGSANTVIGNMFRACERIAYRWFNDGDSGYHYNDGNFYETWNLAQKLNFLEDSEREFLSTYIQTSYEVLFNTMRRSNIYLVNDSTKVIINEILSLGEYDYLKEYIHNLGTPFKSVIDVAKLVLTENTMIPYCDIPDDVLSRLKGKVVHMASSQLHGKQFTDGTVTITINADDLNYSYINKNKIKLIGLLDKETIRLHSFISICENLRRNKDIKLPSKGNDRFKYDITVFEDGYSAAPEAIAIELALYLAVLDKPDFLDDRCDEDWRSKAYFTNLIRYDHEYDRW